MKVHAVDYSFTGSVSITETIETDFKLLYIRCSESGIKAEISINGMKISNRPVLLDLIEIPQNQVILADIKKGSTLTLNLYADDTNQHTGQITFIGA
ncbi:MAG: hypothetical protein GXO22_07310 [Aquificae bacterium]|nr:hypothetical protein [Aquificota bacterium]